MQEATFLILTALADSRQHGYGIITEVREISGGRVQLRAGTLYTALDRLRVDGLIAVDREEIVEGLPAPLLPAHARGQQAAGRRGGPAARQRHGRAVAAESGRRDGDMTTSMNPQGSSPCPGHAPKLVGFAW